MFNIVFLLLCVHSTEKKTVFGEIVDRIAVGLTNRIAVALTNTGTSGKVTPTSPAASWKLQRGGEHHLEHRGNAIPTYGRHLH